MADNYLEKKYEALQERKAKEQRAKQIAWKKRMEAYRKRMEEEHPFHSIDGWIRGRSYKICRNS